MSELSGIIEPTSAPTQARSPWRSAATLAGAYYLIAVTYIVLSTHLASAYAVSVADLERIELAKELAFVTLTGISFFALNLWQLRRLRAHQDERVRRERIIHNAERNIMAGTFARSVAHDINNVLTVSVLAIDELRFHVQHDAAASTMAKDVEDSVNQIKEWNQRFFEIGSSRLMGDARLFDLAHTLRNTAKLARRHDHVREVAIEVAVPERAEIHGREVLVQRAILNLLLNAAEAAGPGARVQLALTPDEGAYHVISVSDSGPGIPPALRRQILEPFYTTKETGTGLGLASVVACASLHDGTVEIDESPLGGARFTLRLRAIVAPA